MKSGLCLRNVTRGTTLATNLAIAETWAERGQGLLGRCRLKSGEGLLITKCRSVHMWFMRFAIDVIFLDQSSRVVWQREALRPWQISPIIWAASSCAELPTGTIASTRTQLGDQLQLDSSGT